MRGFVGVSILLAATCTLGKKERVPQAQRPIDLLEVIAVSPDGKRIITGSRDWGLVCLYENTSVLYSNRCLGHHCTPQGNKRGVYHVEFSADGKIAVSSGGDLCIRVWDALKGKELKRIEEIKTPIYGFAFSPRGREVLLAEGTTLRVYVVDSGKFRNVLTESSEATLTRVAWDPRGRHALTGNKAGTIELWNLETGKRVKKIQAHHGKITRVRYSADGKRALTVAAGREGKVWDTTTWKELCEIVKGPTSRNINDASFLPSGRFVVSTCTMAFKPIQVWEVFSGEVVLESDGTAPCLAVSPDGKKAYLQGESSLTAFDLRTGKFLN